MGLSRAVAGVSLGVFVAIVAGVLPFVSFMAPVLGGAVAGYTRRGRMRAGAGAGALVGVVLALLGVVLVLAEPAISVPAAVVLGPWVRAFGLGTVDSVGVVVAASAGLLVVTGAIGGVVGTVVAGVFRGGLPPRRVSGR